MLRTLRRRLTYANLVSTLALFLVVAGGTALAVDGPLPGQNQVGTQDIINGEVTRGDIGATEVGTDEVANDTGPRALTGDDIANASVETADLSATARGARAYGSVNGFGDLLKSKNIADVTNPETGAYCIDPAAGIDAATAVLIVAPDFGVNATQVTADRISHVEWDSFSPSLSCPTGTLTVRTFFYDGDAIDDDGGVADSPGDDLQPENEGFAFMIP